MIRTTSIIAFALLTSLLLVGGAGTTTADDGAQLIITNATVDENETSTLRLALTHAPAGLSGYEVTLELSDSGVTEIRDASYPDAFQLTTDANIAGDGQRVTLEAAVTDTPPGATNVTLATVNVTGTDAGTTAVHVIDAQIDDDNGSRVTPTQGTGWVDVEPLSNDGTGGDGLPDGSSLSNSVDNPDGSESTTTTEASGPGFGVVVAITALLAVALVARRAR
jgi:PGF-CTERM protein